MLVVEEIREEDFRQLIGELGEEGSNGAKEGDGLEMELQRALEQDKDEGMGEDAKVDAGEETDGETLLREIGFI